MSTARTIRDEVVVSRERFSRSTLALFSTPPPPFVSLPLMGIRLIVASGWSPDLLPETLDFDQDRVVIGRRSGSDVQLPHTAVSGHHATLRASGANYSIIDEGSTNGVKVNGKRIAPRRAKSLANGDVLAIGGFVLTLEFRAIGQAATAETTSQVARRLFAQSSSSGHALFVINGPLAGERIAIQNPPWSMTLGRGQSADLVVPDKDVSRAHAELVHDLRGVAVRDLGSKNGIQINGTEHREARLCHGQEFRLGSTSFKFEHSGGEAEFDKLLLLEDEVHEVLPEIAGVPHKSPSADEFETSDIGSDSQLEMKHMELSSENRCKTAGESQSASKKQDITDNPNADPAAALNSDIEETDSSAIEASQALTQGNQPRADLAIYALAGVVLAISLAGLAWLFLVE